MAEDTQQSSPAATWSDAQLNATQLKDVTFVRRRIEQLKSARKDLYPQVEKVWRDADNDYVPHRTGPNRGRRVTVTDEDKGLRGVLQDLTSSRAWRSDIAFPNPYIKIQAALGVLVDQNPVGVFFPIAKKYQAVTDLIKQLYQRSWDLAKSKQQLKLFIFNLSKYGWAIGRTYPLKIERTTKRIVEYNDDDPEASTYEETDVVVFNDIMRKNIDPWNAWIDDMARPADDFSLRDWAWRDVYSYEDAEEEFGHYKNFKKVPRSGGITTQRLDGKKAKAFKSENLVEVYFYENVQKDLFHVYIAGVPVVMEPLPISDANGLKRLSCWHTFWNVRDAECPYGIGIYEAIRHDSHLYDQMRNMTVDQLKLAIMKMFFYQGTNALTETGDILIEPGKGKQVLDPKAISWMEVPGPGQEAWTGLEKTQEGIDDISGITPPILGEVTGKTAFELAQAKESALKRLKTPLDNVTDALGTEALVTVALMQLLYSIPEVTEITDQSLVDAYLAEVDRDPELFDYKADGTFQAKVYREFPLAIQDDEEGNLIETGDTRFFRIKPGHLSWEGIVNIKPQSVLSPSKQVDKAMELEMFDRLQALMATNAPQIYGKMAREIVRLYDKDPKDVLPDDWMQDGPQQLPPPDPSMMGQNPNADPNAQAAQPGDQPLFVPAGPPDPSAQPSTSLPQQPVAAQNSISGGVMSRFGNLFGGK